MFWPNIRQRRPRKRIWILPSVFTPWPLTISPRNLCFLESKIVEKNQEIVGETFVYPADSATQDGIGVNSKAILMKSSWGTKI